MIEEDPHWDGHSRGDLHQRDPLRDVTIREDLTLEDLHLPGPVITLHITDTVEIRETVREGAVVHLQT